MIHNIAEEREKRNKQDIFPSDAFPEEELLRLIGQVEEQGLIHAPGRLKEDVLQRIDRQRRRERSRRLFSYRVKVLAGMAAALTVLLLLPIEGQNTPDRTRPALLERLMPEEETPDADEWEQTALEREREIDRVWDQYQRKQERKEAGERYLREVKDYLTNNFVWED